MVFTPSSSDPSQRLPLVGGGDKEKKVKDSSFIETAEEKIKSQSQENKEDK